MQHLTEMLVASLAAEEKAVRVHLPFAVNILEKLGLFRTGLVPQRLFIDRALSVYTEATTLYELEALQKSLWSLYEYYAQHQPTLLPPAQNFPVRAKMPFWNTGKPSLSVSEQLLMAIEKGTKHSDPTISSISMLLQLARYTGVNSSSRLKALCQSDKLIVLQNALRALYQDEQGWIILDAVALLLLHRLQQTANFNRILARIGKYFRIWLENFPAITGLSTWQYALNATTFLDRPICLAELSPIAKPLPRDIMLASLTGNVQRSVESNSKVQKHTRVSGEAFLVIDKNDTQPRFAIGSSEWDLIAFRRLNFALVQYQHDEPKGLRNSCAFKTTKDTLLALKRDCETRCSIVVQIIVGYCINLFLQGSAWKPELAASTVIQYASTLKVFALQCWSENTLLIEAQYSADALFTITEDVVDAFDNTLAADRQNTISIFCQFIHQRIPVWLFDNSGLEYIDAGSANTRTHYIAPQLFEAALQSALATSNLQTLWFLRICYYVGLRFTEAMHLHVVDITDEWLYVTRRECRKSHAAIRRVSLCFMPPQVCAEFLKWVNIRKHSSALLFDDAVVNYFVMQALQILRDQSGIANLVVHSLRHCAANNMIWFLSMAAFERQDWRDRYYFCRAQLFTDENIIRISRMFSSLGRRLTQHTQLLEFVASQLGHCSPSVTAASYLHLLDLLFWELNFVRALTPMRENVLPLLCDNNHRFSVWRKGQPYNEDGLFRHSIHGWQTARLTINASAPCSTIGECVAEKLSFSDYVNSLVEYRTQSTPLIDEHLKQHLFQSYCAVDLSELYSISQTPVWMQLLDRINKIKWTRPNINAVTTTYGLLGQKKVRDIRTLRHVLQAYLLLGFQQATILVKCPRELGIPATWRELAERYQLPIKEVTHQKKSTELVLPFLIKPTAKAQKFCLALMLINTFLKHTKGCQI